MHGDGDLLLVASQFAQLLDFFDPSTFEKLATISDVVAQPHELAWDSRRRLAYMAHTYRAGGYGEDREKAHEISVIDPKSRSIIDVIDISPFLAPHDVEYDPIHDRIVTGVEARADHNGLVLIDAESRRVVGSVGLRAPNAHWLSLTPDGAKAYVTHKEAEEISVVDLDALRQVATIRAPGGAEEVDSSPDGRFAYAATPMMTLRIDVSRGSLTKAPKTGSPRPAVVKIDTRCDEVVDRLEFDEFLSAIRVVPDGRVMVSEFRFPPPGTAAPTPGVVNVIDTSSTMSTVASVECDELPFTIRCSPDSTHAFVANVKSGTVSVIDLRTYRVLTTLENNVGGAFGGTHGMCYVPAQVA